MPPDRSRVMRRVGRSVGEAEDNHLMQKCHYISVLWAKYTDDGDGDEMTESQMVRVVFPTRVRGRTTGGQAPAAS
jgi:hypothetical protein